MFWAANRALSRQWQWRQSRSMLCEPIRQPCRKSIRSGESQYRRRKPGQKSAASAQGDVESSACYWWLSRSRDAERIFITFPAYQCLAKLSGRNREAMIGGWRKAGTRQTARRDEACVMIRTLWQAAGPSRRGAYFTSPVLFCQVGTLVLMLVAAAGDVRVRVSISATPLVLVSKSIRSCIENAGIATQCRVWTKRTRIQ